MPYHREAPADAPKIALSVQYDANCPQCGYNLRGMKMDRRCPECGHQVSDLFARPVSTETAEFAERLVDLPLRFMMVMTVAGLLYPPFGWLMLKAGVDVTVLGLVSVAIALIVSVVFWVLAQRLNGEIEMATGTLPLERLLGWWRVGLGFGCLGLFCSGFDVFARTAAIGSYALAFAGATFAAVLAGRSLLRLMNEHGLRPPTGGMWTPVAAGLFLLAAGMPLAFWVPMGRFSLFGLQVLTAIIGVALVSVTRVSLFNPLRRAQGSVTSLNRNRR